MLRKCKENPFTWVGRYGYQWDQFDGGNLFNYYIRQRHYWPLIAAWVSADRIGLYGGTNLYQYVLSRPLLYFDPNGWWGEYDEYECQKHCREVFKSVERVEPGSPFAKCLTLCKHPNLQLIHGPTIVTILGPGLAFPAAVSPSLFPAFTGPQILSANSNDEVLANLGDALKMHGKECADTLWLIAHGDGPGGLWFQNDRFGLPQLTDWRGMTYDQVNALKAKLCDGSTLILGGCHNKSNPGMVKAAICALAHSLNTTVCSCPGGYTNLGGYRCVKQFSVEEVGIPMICEKPSCRGGNVSHSGPVSLPRHFNLPSFESGRQWFIK